MPQSLGGAADGVKVDMQGNVWAAVAGYGVVVWSAEGVLLGGVRLGGTMGDLGFGEPGEVFVMGGDRVWRILVAESVVGVGVGVGV